MRAEAKDAGILFRGSTPESEVLEEKLGAEDDAWRDIALTIIGIPAQTSAGLRVKAETMLLLLQNLALSIARDILAGRAVA